MPHEDLQGLVWPIEFRQTKNTWFTWRGKARRGFSASENSTCRYAYSQQQKRRVFEFVKSVFQIYETLAFNFFFNVTGSVPWETARIFKPACLLCILFGIWVQLKVASLQQPFERHLRMFLDRVGENGIIAFVIKLEDILFMVQSGGHGSYLSMSDDVISQVDLIHSCLEKGYATKPYATMPKAIIGNGNSLSLIEVLGVSAKQREQAQTNLFMPAPFLKARK